MALRTPTREAEDIKRKYGCALSQLADPEDVIEVAGVDDRPSRKLSRRALADVIQPRVEELYELVQAELRRSGFDEVLSSGIVLTGGASVMPGMIELGEEIFHMPVRMGVPKYTGALADVVQSPRFSTAYGLLLEAQAQRKRGQKVQETRNVKQIFGVMGENAGGRIAGIEVFFNWMVHRYLLGGASCILFSSPIGWQRPRALF